MLQVSDSKLIYVRQQVTRQVPLPEEMTVSLDADRLQALLGTIEDAVTEDDFRLLIARLPRRQLNDLFGLLLVVDTQQTGIVDRILEIVEKRSTRSLFKTGWAFYQQHFYSPELSAAMTRLSKPLIAKGEQDLVLSRIAALGCDNQLPIHLSAAWIEEQTKAKKHKTAWYLPTHLLEHAILPESPFFGALLRAYFTRCPVARIADDPELFARCLDQSSQQEQADLLSSLYPDYQLDPKYEAVNRAVLKRFGLPTPVQAHPVWMTTPPPVRQRFRQWALIDRLLQHIRDQKRKHLFYKPLLMKIQGYELLDAQTLALEFEHYTIVDHQDFSHRVIFYDRAIYLKKRLEQTPADELSMPWNGIPTAREAILLKLKADKAVLMLDEINLLYARDFIEEKANPGRRNSVI